MFYVVSLKTFIKSRTHISTDLQRLLLRRIYPLPVNWFPKFSTATGSRNSPGRTNIAPHLFLFISLRASRHAFADVGHSPSLSLTQMFQLFPSIREFDFVYIDRSSGIIVYVLPNVVWPLFVPILNGLVS